MSGMSWADAYDVAVVMAFVGLAAVGLVRLWLYAQGWRDRRYWFRKQAADMWSTLAWLHEHAPRRGTVQCPHLDPSPRPRP
jgi:hypothetical protein